MNITKGKWEVFEPENILSGRQSIAIQAINGNETTSIIVWRESWVGDQETPQQRLADAQLIAEAGTVTNETGYTPRQLAEQKAELLKVIKDCKNRLYIHTDFDACESLDAIIKNYS